MMVFSGVGVNKICPPLLPATRPMKVRGESLGRVAKGQMFMSILGTTEPKRHKSSLLGAIGDRGDGTKFSVLNFYVPFLRKAHDTLKFLGHIMRAILSARPKCSYSRISLKELPLKPVLVLTHATKISTE